MSYYTITTPKKTKTLDISHCIKTSIVTLVSEDCEQTEALNETSDVKENQKKGSKIDADRKKS